MDKYKPLNKELRERMEAKSEEVPSGGGVKHWNDIEGKPFGEVAGEVIIPETKVIFSGSGVNSECYIPASVNALYAGKDYVVSIESEAGKGSTTVTCSEDAYLTCDVDFGLSRSFIIDFTEDGYRISSPYAEGLELIISIQSGPSIQTIDPKYLPSGGGAFVVNFETEDGQTFTADKTYEEINTAFENGKTIKGAMEFGGMIVNLEFAGKGFQGDFLFRNYSYIVGTGISYAFFFIQSNSNIIFATQIVQNSEE